MTQTENKHFEESEEPYELLDAVTDANSFLLFVEALIDDRAKEVRLQKTTPIDDFGRGPNDWENHTIEDFLEAAHAWAKTTNFGDTQNLKGASPWKKFATFLYLGKIYE